MIGGTAPYPVIQNSKTGTKIVFYFNKSIPIITGWNYWCCFIKVVSCDSKVGGMIVKVYWPGGYIVAESIKDVVVTDHIATILLLIDTVGINTIPRPVGLVSRSDVIVINHVIVITACPRGGAKKQDTPLSRIGWSLYRTIFYCIGRSIVYKTNGWSAW